MENSNGNKPQQAIIHILSSYECPVCGEDVGREDDLALEPENGFRAETEKAVGVCGNCKTPVVQDVMVFRLKTPPAAAKAAPPADGPPAKEKEPGPDA